MDARHRHAIARQLREHASGEGGEVCGSRFGLGRRVAMTFDRFSR
jgi:hypothetical protein